MTEEITRFRSGEDGDLTDAQREAARAVLAALGVVDYGGRETRIVHEALEQARREGYAAGVAGTEAERAR
jgi:hypothetical protein